MVGGKRHPVPRPSTRRAATQLRDRNWAYRRSGLFVREDNQGGGIPVAVTLQQLDTMLRARLLAYAPAWS
jgi:hypothetical protein